MRAATSLPRIYADERGLKHRELHEPQSQFLHYAFENKRKNPRDPRESAEKKLQGSCR